MPNYTDIEDAFEFVCSDPCVWGSAVYDRLKDCFYYASDTGDLDEIPEEADDDNFRYVWVPDKQELKLGKPLALRFAREHCPEAEGEIRRIFSSAGAFARFKDFLDQRGKLQQWHEFRDSFMRERIEAWCRDNGIEVTEPPPE